MFPRAKFVHDGDVIWALPLEAMIPPLSGKALKEHALRNKMVSLTYLSGAPLEDEDTIVAPSVDHKDAFRQIGKTQSAQGTLFSTASACRRQDFAKSKML